jgi:peptidoglycan/LPS O-acetylase OafA/YrhL
LICPLIIGFIPVKRLPQVLLCIIFLSILARGFYMPATQDYGMAIYAHTLSRIDVLALGSLFGYMMYHKQIKFGHSLPVRLIIYSIFLVLFFNVDYMESGNFLADTVKKYCFIIPMAYWLGNFMFNKNAMPLAQNLHIFNRFGKASYGIYMFNPVIILLMVIFSDKFALHNYFLFLLMVHILLAFAVFLSYRFFEMPFLNLKEKYSVIKNGDLNTNDETQLSGSEVRIPIDEVRVHKDE